MATPDQHPAAIFPAMVYRDRSAHRSNSLDPRQSKSAHSSATKKLPVSFRATAKENKNCCRPIQRAGIKNPEGECSTGTEQSRAATGPQRLARETVSEQSFSKSAYRTWLDRVSDLGFGALSQCGFAREFHAAFVVDPDAFHPNHLANFGDVFGALNTEVRQL
jgi:hypothetical protein